MGATPWYASRETVMRTLDIAESARLNSQVDDACAAATDDINKALHRTFYPVVATRYFDWPNFQFAGPNWLYLGADELISAASITAGGAVVAPSNYDLDPNTGPPYTRLTARLSGAGLFTTGAAGYQRAIAITGVYGFRNDTYPAGTLAGAINDSTTTINVTDGSTAGVGDLLELGTERVVVTGRTLADTTVNTAGALSSSHADDQVLVADGTAFHLGEQLVVDSERMLVVDIAGNTLIVKRAYSGSTLAAHLIAADIYASRRLTVERAALGTTAASHLDAATLLRWQPPAAIGALHRGLAATHFQQERGGQAAPLGAADSQRPAAGTGLPLLWDTADPYRRSHRVEAI